MLKQKLDSVKTWLKDPHNRGNVYIGSFYTMIAGLTVAAFYAAVKDANAQAEAYNKAVNDYNADQARMEKRLIEEHNSGKTVYSLADGSFISVEKDVNPQILTW